MFITRTIDPIGIVVEAAVSLFGLKRSPLLVRRPANRGPYHEACTIRVGAGFTTGGGTITTGGGGGVGNCGAGAVAQALMVAPITSSAAAAVRRGLFNRVYDKPARQVALRNMRSGKPADEPAAQFPRRSSDSAEQRGRHRNSTVGRLKRGAFRAVFVQTPEKTLVLAGALCGSATMVWLDVLNARD
jgi:hypothetical protein